MGALDPDQRDEVIGLAPSEPPLQLGGAQGMGGPGVASQIRNRCELRRTHRGELERQQHRRTAFGGHAGPAATSDRPGRARRRRDEVPVFRCYVDRMRRLIAAEWARTSVSWMRTSPAKLVERFDDAFGCVANAPLQARRV